MYNYELVISIFSRDEKIKEIVKSMAPLDHFSHNINIYPEFDSSIFESSDVVIYDLNDNLKEVLNSRSKKVIICADNFTSDLTNADAVILRPYDYDYMRYIIQGVFNKISIEEELFFTKNCFNTVIDSNPDMMWIKDMDGIHVTLNKEFCNVVGKKREQILGKDHYEIWDVSKNDPNSGADICKKTEDDAIAAGKTLKFNEGIKSNHGRRQLITYKTPLYDRNGKVIGTVGFGHDVTDLKNLSVENEIFFEGIPYAVLLLDEKGTIENANGNFSEYFNIPKKDIIGTNYSNWINKTFYSERRINESGFIERKTQNQNGEEKVVEMRDEDITDTFGNRTGKICIFRDVTKERKLESQIIRNSNIDFMTKLYNRGFLDKYISTIKPDMTISLLSVDLDHFKDINDTYGHKMGDEAIILTANILNKCFPSDIVVRMGGDEFLVVKVGPSSSENLSASANNLLQQLTINYNNKPEFCNLSASIGISSNTLENISFDALLNESDLALYDAKSKGRNCYCFYTKNMTVTNKPNPDNK